jgi:hypothetical protein
MKYFLGIIYNLNSVNKMCIMNIRYDFNYCINFIFRLLINNFVYKGVHMLNTKYTRIMMIKFS